MQKVDTKKNTLKCQSKNRAQNFRKFKSKCFSRVLKYNVKMNLRTISILNFGTVSSR